VALALAREGVRLAVSARRRDRLEDVARRALAGGAEQARSFTADQTDTGSLQALTASVERELGPVDILIVNGGGPKPGSFTQTPAADWDAPMRSPCRARCTWFARCSRECARAGGDASSRSNRSS